MGTDKEPLRTRRSNSLAFQALGGIDCHAVIRLLLDMERLKLGNNPSRLWITIGHLKRIRETTLLGLLAGIKHQGQARLMGPSYTSRMEK